MNKRLISPFFLAAMRLQLIPAIAHEAEAATTYIDADWEQLRQNYPDLQIAIYR